MRVSTGKLFRLNDLLDCNKTHKYSKTESVSDASFKTRSHPKHGFVLGCNDAIIRSAPEGTCTLFKIKF